MVWSYLNVVRCRLGGFLGSSVRPEACAIPEPWSPDRRKRRQMDDMTISVLIPTNRDSGYLEEAVQSVRDQTVPVEEVILVDDGSPAPGLAKTAARLGVHYVQQSPSGLSIARNTGAVTAHGEWIAFLDDDDIWHSEKIADQVRALRQRPHAVGCFTGGWYMDSDGREFGEPWPGAEAPTEEFLRGSVNIPRIATLLLRRSHYLRLGGCNPAFRQAEDDELILRLLQAGEFVGVDRPLLGYRRHAGNVTNRATQRKHTASERAITLQIWGAEARGDRKTAALLQENLRHYRQRAAEDTVGRLISSLKRRDWSTAAEATGWGLGHAPLQMPQAFARRIRRREATAMRNST